MAFTEEEVTRFRSLAAKAKRALIFFDDDGDGLTSFAMLYHMLGEGKGVPIKTGPEVTEFFLRKVDEYNPDTIFVLDKPRVSQEFIDKVNVPIVWLDHHGVQEPKGEHVHYFNPRARDDADSRPTSYWMYHFIGQVEDSWIGAIGVVADWHTPDFFDDCAAFPGFVPDYKEFKDLYLSDTIGQLVLMLTFIQKGTIKESLQAIRVFTRIEHPDEILKQTTPRGKFLWKRYLRFLRPYERLKKKALRKSTEAGIVHFIYESSISFTKELSNELLLRLQKPILVGRKAEGVIKLSIRSPDKPVIFALQKALEELDGHGGGHNFACGALIQEADWEVFLERFTQAMREEK